METVHVRTQSGTILEMDIDPLVEDRDGNMVPSTVRREIFDGQIARGDLAVIDSGSVRKVEWELPAEKGGVERGYRWETISADDEAPAEPKAKGKAKAAPADDEAPAEG